jgi:hypothetical protein
MGKSKTSGADIGQSEGEQSNRAVVREDKGEIERRLAAMEESVADIRRSHLESHKWFITIIFTGVAILLTVLGIISKVDVREAVRDMRLELRDTAKDVQSKVDNATGDMEKKFQALSGEALKKPLLQIATAQGLLDGQKIEIPWGGRLPLEPLFIKNEGDKRSEPLSIRLYCSGPISFNGGDWEAFASNDKDYPSGYALPLHRTTLGIAVAPKETWTMDNTFGLGAWPQLTNVVSCKLQVFYGADRPAEAKFSITWKR